MNREPCRAFVVVRNHEDDASYEKIRSELPVTPGSCGETDLLLTTSANPDAFARTVTDIRSRRPHALLFVITPPESSHLSRNHGGIDATVVVGNPDRISDVISSMASSPAAGTSPPFDSEALFELAARATTDGLYDWRIPEDAVWFNESFRRTFGHPSSPGTVSIQWWEDRLHPDDRDAAVAGLHDALDGLNDRWVAEYRLRRADGAYANVLECGTIVRDAGRPVRMVGNIIDLTDRKRQEAALAESREMFRAFVEITRDIFALLTPDGRIDFVSPSAKVQLELEPSELIGRSAFDLLNGEDVSKVRRAFERVTSDAGATERIEFRFLGRESERWLEADLVNAIDNPILRGVLVTCRDVSDRHAMQSRIEQAQRLNSLGRLAATVAHEFNNVLMGIQPFAEVIGRATTDERIVQASERIRQAVDRGRRISHEILRFTQPAQPTFVRIELARWITELADELRAVAGSAHSIELAIDDEPHVRVDTGQLAQSLTNIVLNARDAMPEGGVIRIGVSPPRANGSYSFGVIEESSAYAHLWIADAGPGIPPSVLPHIFEPLFTTKRNGTGLGLAVSHQSIQRQGGELLVDTSSHGTTFHLFLPRADNGYSNGTPASSPGYRLQPSARANDILVVEDEENIAEGLRAILELEGYSVTVARSCAEGMDRAAGQPFAAMIVDLGLPDGDGLDLLRKIRETGDETPAIISTGHGDESRLQSIDLAGIAYLLKPYSAEELLEALDAVQHR